MPRTTDLHVDERKIDEEMTRSTLQARHEIDDKT